MNFNIFKKLNCLTALAVNLKNIVSKPPMYRYYIAIEILGLIGTAMIIGLLIANDAKWYLYIYSFIAILFIEFGAYASRDRKHEFPKRSC